MRPPFFTALLLVLALASSALSAQTGPSYDFTAGLQGWTGANLRNLTSTPSGAEFDTEGNDPQFVGPAMSLSDLATNEVVIRMSSTADNTAAQLFHGATFTAVNVVDFTTVNDGVMREYTLEIPALANGARLRLDPTSGTGHIVVESIEVRGAPSTLSLDNGVIKIGVDLVTAGGAITYLSESGSTTNLVNNHDRGRQIQQSYYAGEVLDRTGEGQSPAWSPWSWNPIQVGDAFGNPAELLEGRIEDGRIYTKTIPKLWDMNNEPAECTFETWIELEGNVARVRNRIDIFRTDNIWTQVLPRDQELPAVYTNTILGELKSYIGPSAWTNDSLTTITRIVIPGAESFPWNGWPSEQYPGDTIERWAATVDDSDWGVGVFTRIATRILGGQVGVDGQGEFSGSTMYMSPLKVIAFGPTETFEYEYDLIVGSLTGIRGHVYTQMSQPLVWDFNTDGDQEGWTFFQHTTGETAADGALSFAVTDVDPILLSPEIVAAAPLTPYVHVRMKNETASATAQLFWTNEFGGPAAERMYTFSVSANDTETKAYTLDLSGESGWKGTVTQLRVDPAANVNSGQVMLDGIAITANGADPFDAQPAEGEGEGEAEGEDVPTEGEGETAVEGESAMEGETMPTEGEGETEETWSLSPSWEGAAMRGESLLFVQEGAAPPASATLFTPKQVSEIWRPSTGEVYEAGTDYVVDAANRRITLPEGSAIPYWSQDYLYPSTPPEGPLEGVAFQHADGVRYLLWWEGSFFHNQQVEITYAHPGTEWAAWGGYAPASAESVLPNTFAKLTRAETLSMVVLGDSISVGANASGLAGIEAPPNMPPYAQLVADELGARYGSQILFSNLSVGGQTSAWGLTQIENVNAQNPDIVLIGFGMNDATAAVAAEIYKNNTAAIISGVKAQHPNAEIILVASMLSNPEWNATNEPRFLAYRDALLELTAPGVALADMTAIWKTILDNGKPFHTFTGNNINHPNDFGHRLYAQAILALLQTNGASEGEGEMPPNEGEAMPAEGEGESTPTEGEGETTAREGEATPAEGEDTNGEPTEGELPEGEPESGEGEAIPREGEMPEGELESGEGEAMTSEGETNLEGELQEGEGAEGEETEGEQTEGEQTEGEGIEGEGIEGEDQADGPGAAACGCQGSGCLGKHASYWLADLLLMGISLLALLLLTHHRGTLGAPNDA